MTPIHDEQRAARDERMRRFRASLFQKHWVWRLLIAFVLYRNVLHVIEKRSQWHSIFPRFDLAQLTNINSLSWNVFTVFLCVSYLMYLRMNVLQYRRDQESEAQEALMKEGGQQTEGVWPPTPQKTE